jgi:hypothetical protein
MINGRSLDQSNISYWETVVLGSHILYTDNRLTAISLENHRAARFWANDTSWCIKSKSWFQDYRKSGKLVLFRLHNDNRRYLLSPPFLEFRNGRNRRLNLRAFIDRFPNIEVTVRGIVGSDCRALFYFELARPDTHFDHSLDLSGLGIASLPSRLSIRDDLVLRHNPIPSLPDDIVVGGNLDIRETCISTIPAGVQIAGKIFR